MTVKSHKMLNKCANLSILRNTFSVSHLYDVINLIMRPNPYGPYSMQTKYKFHTFLIENSVFDHDQFSISSSKQLISSFSSRPADPWFQTKYKNWVTVIADRKYSSILSPTTVSIPWFSSCHPREWQQDFNLDNDYDFY